MRSASTTELQLTIDTERAGRLDALPRTGQLVQGRVLDIQGNRAQLDILGQVVEVQLADVPAVGSLLTLRVLDVSGGTANMRVLEKNTLDGSVALADETSPAGSASDVVRSVRRLVDAAATRIFGGSAPRSNPPRVLDLSTAAILKIASRGDRPRMPLVSFEPEALAASSSLAAASSEELLAAQAALERLEVPATPLTMAAALPDANNPARLVSTLQRLQALLGTLSPEGRIGTLQTLADFLSQIRPQEEAIDAQISSFVEQIATGGERKLLELLTALAQRGQSDAAARLLLTARATERATSLTNDLKTQLLAINNGKAIDLPLATLLTEALEAVTAAQLTSLHAARTMPGAIAFVLPIADKNGTLAAQVSVQRDAPEGRNRRLDADNFRIVFSLETRRFGLVRIDVEAVARALRVTIETQTPRAAEILRAALDRLRQGFDERGYRSVAMTAQAVRRSPYQDGAPVEEPTRTYLPTKHGGSDGPDSVHWDTRA